MNETLDGLGERHLDVGPLDSASGRLICLSRTAKQCAKITSSMWSGSVTGVPTTGQTVSTGQFYLHHFPDIQSGGNHERRGKGIVLDATA